MNIINYFKNKPLRCFLATGLALSLLTGCKEYRTELSDILHEDAKVVRMEHEDFHMRMVPMLFDDHLIMRTETDPEENIIEFDGPVDFKVDDGEIYNRFKKGDAADVSYRESYSLTFEDLNEDMIKEQTAKKFIGYKFVDAQPKK